ncbi:hypothetical protein OC834_005004 [Tilletia horrida]|nr:hypothetical protein OC834_005004 [Tilletia horrida]
MGRPILQSEALEGKLQSTTATRAHAKRMRAEQNWCCEHGTRADECYGCTPAHKKSPHTFARHLSSVHPTHGAESGGPGAGAGAQQGPSLGSISRDERTIIAHLLERRTRRDAAAAAAAAAGGSGASAIAAGAEQMGEAIDRRLNDLWTARRRGAQARAPQAAPSSGTRTRVQQAEDARLQRLLDAHLDRRSTAPGSSSSSHTTREITIDGPVGSANGGGGGSAAAFRSETPPSDEVSILRSNAPLPRMPVLRSQSRPNSSLVATRTTAADGTPYVIFSTEPTNGASALPTGWQPPSSSRRGESQRRQSSGQENITDLTLGSLDFSFSDLFAAQASSGDVTTRLSETNVAMPVPPRSRSPHRRRHRSSSRHGGINAAIADEVAPPASGPDERSSSIGTTAPAAHQTSWRSYAPFASAGRSASPALAWDQTLAPLLPPTGAGAGESIPARSARTASSSPASSSQRLPPPPLAQHPRSRTTLEQWASMEEEAAGHDASAFESIMDGLDALSPAERREVLRVLADRVRRTLAQEEVEQQQQQPQQGVLEQVGAAAAGSVRQESHVRRRPQRENALNLSQTQSHAPQHGRARHFMDRSAAIRALLEEQNARELALSAAAAPGLGAAPRSPVPCPIIFPGGVDGHASSEMMQVDSEMSGPSGSGSGSSANTPPSDSAAGSSSSPSRAASSLTSAAGTPLHASGSISSSSALRIPRQSTTTLPSIEDQRRSMLDCPEDADGTDGDEAVGEVTVVLRGRDRATGQEGAAEVEAAPDSSYVSTSSALVERMHRALMATPERGQLPPAPAPLHRE